MVVGHQKQWHFLKKMNESGKIPHALLFSGESQIGKKKIALELSKAIFCSSDEDYEKPCGKCFSCKSVEKGSHPDLILINPEIGKNILVSQIRDLILKLSFKPYSANYKIALINDAHLMEEEAQNCLLKTLEEPKGNSTLLILITEYPETLFPTILSRVEKIKFFPANRSEIEKYLSENGLEKSKAEYFSSLCSGRVGRAIDFSLNQEKIKEREKMISDLKKIIGSEMAFRFKYAKEYSDSLKEILDVWLDYFRDNLFSSIKDAKKASSVLKIKKTIFFIQYIRYLYSTTNINPRLALEILLMEV